MMKRKQQQKQQSPEHLQKMITSILQKMKQSSVNKELQKIEIKQSQTEVNNEDDWEDEEQEPFPYEYDQQFSEQEQKISESELELMDQTTYQNMKSIIESQGIIDCSICYRQFQETQQQSLRELPCGHFYHKQCVDIWLKQKAKCPICKLNPKDY